MPAGSNFSVSSASFSHEEGTIGLDHAGGEIAFSSHAHSDHSSFLRKAAKVVASEQTIELWQAREGKSFEGSLVMPKGAKLYNAGHILGARQLRVEADGETLLYTGDLNASPSLTCTAAEIPSTDVLVVECTYGAPHYSFPSRQQVCTQIAAWAKQGIDNGENVVLGGYSLGKAQELVKALNEFAGIAPLVNQAIAKVCKVYNRHGCNLDFITIGTDEADRMLEKTFASVLPMNQVTPQLGRSLSSHYGRNTRTGVATGWALDGNYSGVDAAFPLSDHSDFNSLFSFVQSTGAKKVFCTHGFSQVFAAELRKKGIDAHPLDSFRSKNKTERQAKTLVEYA